MDLAGRRALVTGASRGIGKATALLFAEKGADVAVNYLSNEEGARQVAGQIEGMGRKALLLQADVGRPKDVTAMFERLRQEWGGVTVLVNNAGGPAPGSLLDADDAVWESALAVHVQGPVRCARLALPFMIERNEGVIVNVSSTAALLGVRNMTPYGTAKAAVLQLTRCLAYDVSEHNVRVNCVAPGITETDFHASTPPEMLEHSIDNRVPLHRLGSPENVAKAIVALVENDYITGQVLTVDGGLTMRIA